MTLRKEVLHRLLLAKSILATGRNAPLGVPNPHLVARQVLSAHDAADLVFAAIADHQRKLTAIGKAPSIVECLKLIDTRWGDADLARIQGRGTARRPDRTVDTKLVLQHRHGVQG
jgi:hypothetical protein